jgi:uncharacterized damage-inducible protein DinB
MTDAVSPQVTTLPGTPERVRNYRQQGLAATPVLLEHLLEGITDTELDRRPDPERFTLREAVAHVADWEGIWLERMRLIVAEEDPYLPGYDEGQWAVDHDYAHADLGEQLAKFRAGREVLTAFLADLPPEAYGRVGRHGEIGLLTLGDLATLVLAHDAYHLRQVAEFRRAG